MSTGQGAAYGCEGAREFSAQEWRGWGGRSRFHWHPIELVAMILGFIVFWPIGLAILAFKFWQRKSGYQGDLQTAAQEKWRDARQAMKSGPWMNAQRWGSQAGFGVRSTGNSAFDDWRAAEIAKLEEERRKLEQAHREFAEFLDNIRKSKDREEFERFMAERRARGGTDASMV